LPFRILIADDHPAVRCVLRFLIESHLDWQVCGEAVNGFEAVIKVGELKPDLVILDLAMPVMDGVRAAREISNVAPGLPILMHTMHASPILTLEAKKYGVSKVVTKCESGENLLSAIEDLLSAAQGTTVADAGVRILEGAAESTAPAAERPDEWSASCSDGKEKPEPN
jgi:DNA-binding NarL/FixJ family response regulator